ncbi:DUF5776 domain-containing protein [Lentilactobacillus raoultii]|uniref:DUF5776 domain-containing protein n=1 Tax=Lentilactobacillus raoultii TaxID=1987503 RepID=A0ABW3PNP3_9LACO|nr:DUF5776 domain-containing protein [Lentilactobacillus raoultii]
MRGRKNISRNNRIGRAEKQNLHYRLRKHKKHWLTTSLYTLGVGTVILFGGSNDRAAADSSTASPDTTPIEETAASPGKQSSSQTVPAKPAGAYQKETGTQQQAQGADTQSQTSSTGAATAASSATQPTSQASQPTSTAQASQASQTSQAARTSQVSQPAKTSQATQASQPTQSSAGTNQAAATQASHQQTTPQASAGQATGNSTNNQQSASTGQQAGQGQATQSTAGQPAAAQAQTASSAGTTPQQSQRSTAAASSATTNSAAPAKNSSAASTNQSTSGQPEATSVNQDQSQPKVAEKHHQEESSAEKAAPTTRVKRSLQLADEQADADSKSAAAQKAQKDQATDPLEGLRQNYDETTNVIKLTNATKADQTAALKQAAEIFKITGKKPTIQYTSTTKLASTTDINNPDYRSGWQQAQKSIDEINKPISSAGALVLQVGDLGKIGHVLDAYVASHAEDENGIIDPKQVTTSHTMMDNSGQLIWSGTWKEGGVLGIGAKEVSANDKNDNFKLGYADYLSTYATEVQQYINKVKANAMDPRFGDKLVNSNAYRSKDLESNVSVTGIVNLLGTLILNTTVKDNPEVFAYQETSGLNRDVSSQTRKTVESLQKFVNIVLPFIQNGIIKQALTDIRSIGMEYVDSNGNQSVSIPATLGGDDGALALNGTLKTIADIVGLRKAANSSTANSLYLALANGIKNAILRHANVGVQTALNEVMDPSTGATGIRYTGLGLNNYQVNDPVKAANSDQKVAVTEFVSAEAYAWAKKVIVPVMQMAARDKLTGDPLKQDGKTIAEALYVARAITLEDLNNLQGHQRSGVYENYQPSNEGALKFIYSLYENEAGAVDKAIKDFLDGQPATDYQFVNEGNHDKSTNTVSNKDYNQIYDYLASSDVKENLVAKTKELMDIYRNSKHEAGIAKDSKRFFEDMQINADISKITSPTLTSSAVKSELDKIVEDVVTTYYNDAARAYNLEFGTQQGTLDATAGKAMTLGYDESYSVPYQKAYEQTEAKLVVAAKQQAADDFNANRKADASAYQNAKAVSAYNEAFESTQKAAIASAKEQAGKDMNQNVSLEAGIKNYTVTAVTDAYRTAYEEAKAAALSAATVAGKNDYQAGKALQSDYSQNSDVKAAYEKAYNDDKNGFLKQATDQAAIDMTAGKTMVEGVKAFEKGPDAATAYRQAYQTALDKAIESAKKTAETDYRAGTRQYFSRNQQVEDAYLQAYKAIQTQTIEEAKIQAVKDLNANVPRATGVLKYSYDKDAVTAYNQVYQDARGDAFKTARVDAKKDYLAGQSLRDQYSVNVEIQEVYRQAFNDTKKETLTEAKKQASQDMTNNIDVQQGASKYQFDADAVNAYQQAYETAKTNELAFAKTLGQKNYESGNKLDPHYSQNVDVQKAFEEAYLSAQAAAIKSAVDKAPSDMANAVVTQYRDPVVIESYRKAYAAAQDQAVAQAKLDADRDYKANQRQKTYSLNRIVQAAYDSTFNQNKKATAEAAVAQAGTDLAANVAKEIGGKAFENDAEAKALYEKTYDKALAAGKTKATEDGTTDYNNHQQLRNNYHANVEIQSAYKTAYENAQKAAIKTAVAKAATDMAKGVTKPNGLKGYVDQAVISAYDQAYENALTDAKRAAEKAAETDYQTTATPKSISPNTAVQNAYYQSFKQQQEAAMKAAVAQAANDVKSGVSKENGIKSLNKDPKVVSAYTTAYQTAVVDAVKAAGKQAADDYRNGQKATTVSQNSEVQRAYDKAYQALKDQAVVAAKTQAGEDVAKGIAKAVGVQTYANDVDAAAAYNQAYETAKATAIDQAKRVGIADYQNCQTHRDNYSANQEIQATYDQAFTEAQATAVDKAQQTAEQDARNGRPKVIDTQDPKVLTAYEKAYETAEKQAVSKAIGDADSDYQSGKEKRSNYSKNQAVQDAYDRAYAQNKAEGLAAATQSAAADVLNNVDRQSGRAKFTNDPDAQKHYDTLYEQTLKDGLAAAAETAADDYRQGQPKKETYSPNKSINAAYQAEYDRQKQTALAGTFAQAAGDIAAGITVEQGAAKYQNDQQAVDKYRQDYLETLNKAVTAAEAAAKEDYRLTGQKKNDAKHAAIVKAYDQAFDQAKATAGEQAKKQAPQDVETGVTLTDGQQAFANDLDVQQIYANAYNETVDKGKAAAEKQAVTDYQSGQPQTTYSQNAAIQQVYEMVMAEQRSAGRTQAIEQAGKDVEAGASQAEGAAKFNHDQAAKDAYAQTYQQTLTKAQTAARQQAVEDYQKQVAKNNAYSQNTEIQAAYDQEFEKMHQATVTHLPEVIAEDIKAGTTETAGADRYRHDPIAQQQYLDAYHQAVEAGKQAAAADANNDYRNGQKQSPYSRQQAINEAYEAAYQQNQQTGRQTAVTTASGDVDQGISKAEGAAKFANDADAKAAYEKKYDEALQAGKDQASQTGQADYDAGHPKQVTYSQNDAINQAYQTAYEEAKQKTLATTQAQAAADVAAGIAMEAGDDQYQHDTDAAEKYRQDYEAALTAAKDQATETAKNDYQAGREPQSQFSQNKEVQKAYETAFNNQQAIGIKQSTEKAVKDVEGGMDKTVEAGKIADKTTREAYEKAYDQALEAAQVTATTTGKADYDKTQTANPDYSQHPAVQKAYETAFEQAKQAALNRTDAQAVTDIEAGITKETGRQAFGNDQQATAKYDQAYDEALAKRKVEATATAEADYAAGKGQNQQFAKQEALQKAYDQAYQDAKAKGAVKAEQTAVTDVDQGVDVTEGIKAFANDPDAQRVYEDQYAATVKAGQEKAGKDAVTDYQTGQKKTPYSRNSAINQAYETAFKDQKAAGHDQAITTAAEDVAQGRPKNADAFKHDADAQKAYQEAYDQKQADAEQKATDQAKADYQAGKSLADYDNVNAGVKAAYQKEYQEAKSANLIKATQQGEKDAKAGVDQTTSAKAFEMDVDAKANYDQAYQTAVETGTKIAEAQADADYKNQQPKNAHYSPNQTIQKAYEQSYETARNTAIAQAALDGKRDADTSSRKPDNHQSFNNDEAVRQAYNQAYNDAVKEKKAQAEQQAKDDYQAGRTSQKNYSQNTEVQKAYDETYKQAKEGRITEAELQAGTDVDQGISASAGAEAYANDLDAKDKYLESYKQALDTKKKEAADKGKNDYNNNLPMNPTHSKNSEIQADYEQAYQQAKETFAKEAERQAGIDVTNGVDRQTGAEQYSRDPEAQNRYKATYDRDLNTAKDQAKDQVEADYMAGQHKTDFKHPDVQQSYDDKYQELKDNARKLAESTGREAGRKGEDLATGKTKFSHDADAQKAFEDSYRQGYQEVAKQTTVKFGDGHATMTTGPDGKTEMTVSNGQPTSIPADGQSMKIGDQGVAIKDRNGDVTVNDGQGTTTIVNAQNEIVKVVTTEINPQTGVITVTTKDGKDQVTETKVTTKPTNAGTTVIRDTGATEQPVTVIVNTKDSQGNPMTQVLTPNKVETLPTGETALLDRDGNVTITDENGQSVTTNEEGTVIGTHQQTEAATTTTRQLPDGNLVTIQADKDGHTTVTMTTPDGQVTPITGSTATPIKDQSQQSTGKMAVTDGKGNVIIRDADGNATTINASGQITQVTTVGKDGTVTVENLGNVGETTSSVVTNPDGTVTVTTPDGTETKTATRDQTGQIVTQSEKGSENQEVKVVDGQVVVTHFDNTGKTTGTTTTVTEPTTGKTIVTNRDAAGHVIAEMIVKADGTVTVNKPASTVGSGAATTGPVINPNDVNSAGSIVTETGQSTATTITTPATTIEQPDSVGQTQNRYYQKLVTKTVVTVKGLYRYSRSTFNKRYRVGYVRPGSVLHVIKVIIRPDGITRLQLSDGTYITGLKSFNQFRSIARHYHVDATAVIRVTAKKGVYTHSSPRFTRDNQVKRLKKGTVLKVRRIVRQGKTTRFELTNGQYVTARKSAVQLIQRYYTKPVKTIKVINQKGINSYSKKTFTKAKRVSHYSKGRVLKVTQLVKSGLTTRFQLEDGSFITANKKLVVKTD